MVAKVFGNNVITAEQHLHAIGRDMQNEGVEHEDVAMKLLATSLTEDAQRWFDGLPDDHLTTYKTLLSCSKAGGH
jgi:hypothetical protein